MRNKNQTLRIIKSGLIKSLGLFLLMVIACCALNSHHVFAAAAHNSIDDYPADVSAGLQSYDGVPETQLYALSEWISLAGDPSNDGPIIVPAGAPSLALQLNHAVTLYHGLLTNGALFPSDGSPNAQAQQDSLQNEVQIQNLTASSGTITNVPAGQTQSIGLTQGTRFWDTGINVAPGFTYIPPGGSFVAGETYNVTITFTYSEINTWPNGAHHYQCATNGAYVSSSTDWAHCPSSQGPFLFQIDVPATQQPTSNVDAATCTSIAGWAFDSNDPSDSLNMDIYVNGPAGSGAPTARYPVNQPSGGQDNPPDDVDGTYGITGNHRFNIDPETDNFLSTYANSGSAFTIYMYVLGVNSSGGPDGNNPLIGQETIGPCNGPGGTTTGSLGSATCVTPPGFDPSRLPYDPGEQVAVTTSVTYTPPSGTSGGVPGQSSYVSYQQGTPAPTVTLTSPTWSPDLGTSDVGAGTSLTTKFIVPNTPGPYNVNWTYNWTVLEITNIYHPAVTNAQNVTTPAYYTSTSVTVPQQQTCTWPGGTGPPTVCVGGDSSSCTTTCPDGSSSCTTTCTGGGTACSTTCIDGSPTCLNVAYYPYFRVYGGDISAGGTCSGTPSASIAGGGIYGWPTLSSEYTNWSGGAGTQFGEDASGVISGAASAANVASGSPNPPPTGLSFSNQSTAANSYIYGGCSGGVDVPAHNAAYYDQVPAGTGPLTNGESLSGLASGDYSSTTDVNIPASSIADGTHLTIYVTGNVEISGNIVFAGDDTGWNSTNQIPSVWIIASGNIAIDPSVAKLDGIYVAKGYINTCDVDTSSAAFYTDCDNQLTVNGSFITGGNVYLNRTYGTVSQSTGAESSSNSNAGEVFNYNPLLFLPTQTEVSPNYDAITSLPPVL